jgi:hypothetical protein
MKLEIVNKEEPALKKIAKQKHNKRTSTHRKQ